MKIGQKLIAVILILMALFISVVLLQKKMETDRLNAIFRERKQINSINFNQITEMMNKKLDSYVVETTYWDELVQAVEKNDTTWFNGSIEPGVITLNKFDGVWIYNIKKEMVYSTGTDDEGFSAIFPISSEDFDKLLDGKVSCHFFLYTKNTLLEINGAKIYPGNDPERKTPSRGYLFAAKSWNESYIRKIAAITSSKISIYPYKREFLKDESDFDKGKIFFSHIFYGCDGKPVAIANSTNEFTQIKILNENSKNDIYLFLYFAITLISIILYCIIKLINLPLKTISDSLKKNDVNVIKSLQSDKSEFGDVARLIIRFFEQRNALNEKEEKYRMIFNTANDSILVMQKDKFLDCNPKTLEIFGCTREEILNSAPYIFSPPAQPEGNDSIQKALEKIDAAIAGKSQRFEWVHCKYDKTPFDAEVSLNAFKIGGEEYILAIVRDITERKKAEEEMKRLNSNLEEANQELRNFVYIASHDLREPLRKIIAFGGILQKSLANKLDSENAENLQFVIQGAMRMNRMIEGLLAYSRVSTRTHLPQNVDLNVIVQQLQQFELSVALEEKKANVSVPKPLPYVEVDPVQISQLMQNLIANAIKYQEKNTTPQVTITSKPAANGMVQIRITDNGIGIKPEFHQAIFVMFKRVQTAGKYEGNGIGLAVCKKIVERLGGKIGVESEPGKGSTFWFTVPEGVNAKVQKAEAVLGR
jgi:PAS domain S-box-containing protein